MVRKKQANFNKGSDSSKSSMTSQNAVFVHELFNELFSSCVYIGNSSVIPSIEILPIICLAKSSFGKYEVGLQLMEGTTRLHKTNFIFYITDEESKIEKKFYQAFTRWQFLSLNELQNNLFIAVQKMSTQYQYTSKDLPRATSVPKFECLVQKVEEAAQFSIVMEFFHSRKVKRDRLIFFIAIYIYFLILIEEES